MVTPLEMSEIGVVEAKIYDLQNLGFFEFKIEKIFGGVTVAYYGKDRHLTMENFKLLFENRCCLLTFSGKKEGEVLDSFRFIVNGIPDYSVRDPINLSH